MRCAQSYLHAALPEAAILVDLPDSALSADTDVSTAETLEMLIRQGSQLDLLGIYHGMGAVPELHTTTQMENALCLGASKMGQGIGDDLG